MHPTHHRTSPKSSLLLVTCSLVLAASCHSGIELLQEEQGSGAVRLEQPIVNGQSDSSHSAVGMLQLFTGSSGGLCTGTLIGSRTVLTAAHCVYGISGITFHLGGQVYQAASATPHPSYSPSVLTANDVAVIRLSQAVSGIQPVLISQAQPHVGQSLTIVGFGVTQYGASNSGIKRVALNVIASVSSQYFRYQGASGTTGNTCSGDSGGPSFTTEGGVEKVVGVHSTATMPCGSAGNDMRMDVFYTWVASEAGSDLAGTDTSPPAVSITSPAQGATVKPDLTVQVAASDTGSGLLQVQLFVDGQAWGTQTTSPASFPLTGLSEGTRTIKADARDKAGNTASAQVTVKVVKSTGSTSPPPAQSPPPATSKSPAAFGSGCTSNSGCQSGLCAYDTFLGSSYCTQSCGGTGACPASADCVPTGSIQVCALRSSPEGSSPAAEVLQGGCAVAGRASPDGVLDGALELALPFCLALALIGRRRRRTSPV